MRSWPVCEQSPGTQPRHPEAKGLREQGATTVSSRPDSVLHSQWTSLRIGIDHPYTGENGRTTWAGKDILLGSNWYGNLDLSTVK